VIESVTGNPYGAAVNADAAGKVEVNNQNSQTSTANNLISTIGSLGTTIATGLLK